MSEYLCGFPFSDVCGKCVWFFTFSHTMQPLPKYMQLRRRGYYAVLEIPKALRPIFDNKARFVKSLGTRDLRVAEQRLGLILLGWRKLIEKAKGSDSALAGVQWEYEQWRSQIESITDDLDKADVENLAHDRVEELLRTRGREAASEAYAVIFKKAQPLAARIDEWMASIGHLAEKTQATSKKAAMELCEHFKTTADIDKEGVKRFLVTLRTDKKLSDKTLSCRLSFIRSFISHLDEKYGTDLLPLFTIKALSRGADAKSAKQRAWVPFKASEVAHLYQAAINKEDVVLADIIACAAYTGCRIEELGQIKLEHVTEESITIADSKTAAGIREVPLHPALSKLMNRLVSESADGYILKGSDKGSYGKRTDALGKRFGQLKRQEGFSDQHVFHSIRKTVVSQLEQAGVSENTTADIIGHDKPRITYGLYSAGTSLQQKAEALSKVRYTGALGNI